jgi:hypothetical protein
MNPYGIVTGADGGGSSGSQDGSALATTGLGSISFEGTSEGLGAGGFGGGVSPPDLITMTVTTPGAEAEAGDKKGDNATADTPPTTTTTVTQLWPR